MATAKELYQFLRHSDNEGFRDDTYVPFSNDGTGKKSGVTIGVGYDLGSKTVSNLLEDGFSLGDVTKLERFLGKQGKEAKEELDKGKEYVEEAILDKIGEAHTGKSIERLRKILPNWDLLIVGMQKIALSSYTQYGESKFKKQNLYKQIKANDVSAVKVNVNNWGDRTPNEGKSINARYKRYVSLLP